MAKEPVKKDDAPVPFSRPPIEVLERSLTHPFGLPSVPIDLKESGWTCAWANADVRPNRIWEMQERGYLPVRIEELKFPDQVGDFVSENGFVVRGIHGRERLYRIPTDHYIRLQKVKASIREQNIRNPSRMKEEVVAAAGAKLGSEAGDFLNKTHVIGNVTTTRERIEQLDED